MNLIGAVCGSIYLIIVTKYSPLCTHKMQHHYDAANLGPYLDGTPALPLRSEFSAQVSLISNHFCCHASLTFPSKPVKPILPTQQS